MTTTTKTVDLSAAVLESLLFTPGHRRGNWGLPLAYWGPPGVGKSTTIRDVAERCGLPVVTRYASIHDPTDFAGMPVVGDGCVEQLPLAWARDCAALENCVLFIDEVTTAAPATQNALLGVALERTIGDLQLPIGVRVVIAGNPAEIAVAGRDLGPAQANRFAHFTCGEPTVPAWTEYMLSLADTAAFASAFEGNLTSYLPKVVEHQKRVLAEWPAEFAAALALVTAFVSSTSGTNNSLSVLFKMPSEDSPDYGGAWPSPRSWEVFARALAGARIHKLSVSDQLSIATACLGHGVAMSIAQWLAYGDLPDPAAVLDGQLGFVHDDSSPARTIIATSAMVQTIKTGLDHPNVKSRVQRFYSLLMPLLDTRPDLVAISARPLMVKDKKLKAAGCTSGLGQSLLIGLQNTGLYPEAGRV